MVIPENLLDQLERDNALLFVGEGINRGILPSSAELTERLAVYCSYPQEEPLSLPRVAGYCDLTLGRHSLISFLRDELDNSSISPLRTHRLAAQLRPPIIVTTCYDRLIESALRQAGMAYAPVVGNVDVAYTSEDRTMLVWLWGVIDQPDSLVITEDDQRLLLETRASVVEHNRPDDDEDDSSDPAA